MGQGGRLQGGSQGKRQQPNTACTSHVTVSVRPCMLRKSACGRACMVGYLSAEAQLGLKSHTVL